MNKLIAVVLLALVCLVTPARAAWTGRLDLSPSVSPIMIRELHDGQWLAGIGKSNLWHLDQDGKQRLHVGVFQAWNAEKGNPATGINAGVDLPPGFAAAASAALPEGWRAGAYVKTAVSLDFFGGYRPSHTPDTHAWIYGIGAKLSIDFGVKELQKGL